jgi:hypothetical protein
MTYKLIQLTFLSFVLRKFFEACAVQISTSIYSIIVICIYRPPSGNLYKFCSQLDLTLAYLHKSMIEFVICGDFNVNFLND